MACSRCSSTDKKKGTYSISDQEISPELKAIFCIDKRTLEITDRVEKLENNMTIDYSQQEELRTLAVKKVVAILGGKNTPAYRELNKKHLVVYGVILKELWMLIHTRILL